MNGNLSSSERVTGVFLLGNYAIVPDRALSIVYFVVSHMTGRRTRIPTKPVTRLAASRLAPYPYPGRSCLDFISSQSVRLSAVLPSSSSLISPLGFRRDSGEGRQRRSSVGRSSVKRASAPPITQISAQAEVSGRLTGGPDLLDHLWRALPARIAEAPRP